jgi:hypothetical protein
MNGFISRLIDRHINPSNKVLPRIQGRFESDASTSAYQEESHLFADGRLNDSLRGENHNENKDLTFHHDPLPDQKTKIDMDVRSGSSSSTLYDNRIAQIQDGKEYKKSPSGKMHPNPDSELSDLTVRGSIPDAPYFALNQMDSKSNSEDLTGTGISISGDHDTIGKAQRKVDLTSIHNSKNKDTTAPSGKINQTETFSYIDGKDTDTNENSIILNRGILRPPEWIGNWAESKSKSEEAKFYKSQNDPVVKVNIGRIEVKAVIQQNTSQIRKAEPQKPRMSLDDYLNNKSSGKR